MTLLSDPAPVAPLRRMHKGPAYREFIKLVTQLSRAKNYLEIGVHNGSSLAMIDCASIGVDPEFKFDRNPMGKKPALHLYQMTSDEYFRQHDPRALFGSPVDIAFLDGMHLFEFLLRDFINTEKVCGDKSIILLDDCLPVNVEMTERDHRPAERADQGVAGWWTGDVWKVVAVLREYRPDLLLTPVDVQPTGSIAVSRLDPQSTRLIDCYDEIIEKYQGVAFSAESYEAYWADNAPVTVPEAVAALFPHIQVQRIGQP